MTGKVVLKDAFKRFTLDQDMVLPPEETVRRFKKRLEKIDLEKNLFCVTSDHSTPCKMKTHSDDPVPVVISGNKIHGDDVQEFSEKTCRNGSLGVLERGTRLMPELMGYLKA